MKQATDSNPLGLGTIYEWQPGDTMALIAMKYRRPSQWTDLLEANIGTVSRNGYIMKPGDLIQVPENWFPLPDYSFDTKYKGSSIMGRRANECMG